MVSLGTTANSVVEVAPNSGMKMLTVKVLQSALATTTGVNPGDTFTLDLSPTGPYGGTGQLWYMSSVVHTSLNSTIVPDTFTTTMSAAGVLTVTIGTGASPTLASSKTRVFTILYS